VGWASAQEIDRLNILQATHLAARRALAALSVRPDLLLTDWLKLADTEQPVEALVKGDARSQAIAAASVIAKVTRDRWMRQLDAEYPVYGFAGHKGYGVAAHLAALREAGLEAKRERGHTSSLARLAGLAERLGRGARTHTAAGPTAQCCAP